jgi:hypothetical protein
LKKSKERARRIVTMIRIVALSKRDDLQGHRAELKNTSDTPR